MALSFTFTPNPLAGCGMLPPSCPRAVSSPLAYQYIKICHSWLLELGVTGEDVMYYVRGPGGRGEGVAGDRGLLDNISYLLFMRSGCLHCILIRHYR